MGIELKDGSARRGQPAEGPDGGGAVTAEHQGKVASRVSRPNLDREPSRELERGSDFGRIMGRVVLEDLNIPDDVSLALEMGRQSSAEKMLRAGTTPPA